AAPRPPGTPRLQIRRRPGDRALSPPVRPGLPPIHPDRPGAGAPPPGVDGCDHRRRADAPDTAAGSPAENGLARGSDRRPVLRRRMALNLPMQSEQHARAAESACVQATFTTKSEPVICRGHPSPESAIGICRQNIRLESLSRFCCRDPGGPSVLPLQKGTHAITVITPWTEVCSYPYTISAEPRDPTRAAEGPEAHRECQ